MKHRILSLIALVASFSLASVHADPVPYTSGHGDIGVGYEEGSGEFEPHWHLDEEYAPEDAFAVISGFRSSPTGTLAMLGVADGSLIWVAGSSAYQPNLGIATEELVPEDWVGNITFSLTDWSGPGEFALYTTNAGGGSLVDVYFSTYNPASTFGNNSFEMFAGSHEHFTLGFTAPGYYELEFTWSGTHVTDGAVSTSAVFGFQVVPEPGAALPLALVAGGFLVSLRYRRRVGSAR